jgi:hypothetical protein
VVEVGLFGRDVWVRNEGLERGSVLAAAIPSGLVYWSISSIIELKTSSSGWVTMRPTEVVSRSGGNSSVVSIGPSAKKIRARQLGSLR